MPTIINSETAVPGCNVTLKWTTPISNGCPISFYTVQYRQTKSGRVTEGWTTINVTGKKVNQQQLNLNCTTSYEFMVKAWNALGSSHLPPKAWPITTGGGRQTTSHSQGESEGKTEGTPLSDIHF